jgi:hypothetical protein
MWIQLLGLAIQTVIHEAFMWLRMASEGEKGAAREKRANKKAAIKARKGNLGTK